MISSGIRDMAAIHFIMWRPCHSVMRPSTRPAPGLSLPMRQELRVMVVVITGLRVGVHYRGSEPRQGMQQGMLRADRDLVGLDRRSGSIDDDLALGAELVADPAQPD